MADATNRKLDVDRNGNREIARDDPLFELSQIIGYSQPRQSETPAAPHSDEPIDLEQELMRELESYPGYSSGLESTQRPPESRGQPATTVHVESRPARVEPAADSSDLDIADLDIADLDWGLPPASVQEPPRYAGYEATSRAEPELSAELDQELELGLAEAFAAEPAFEPVGEPEYAAPEAPEYEPEPDFEPAARFASEPEYDPEPEFTPEDAFSREPDYEPAPQPHMATAESIDDALTRAPPAIPAEAEQPDVDTLEAELMTLLGGLGGTSMPVARAESPRPAPAPVLAPEPARPEPVQAVAEHPPQDRDMTPQVPAAPPFWFEEQMARRDQEPPVDDWEEPADEELLDSFERELSGGLAAALGDQARDQRLQDDGFADEPEAAYEEPAYLRQEQPAAALPSDDDMRFNLNLEDEHGVDAGPAEEMLGVDEEAALREMEAMAGSFAAEQEIADAPVLDTAEMPSGDVEAMAPLDLPDPRPAEERKRGAVNIERELDVALTGYDHYEEDRAARPAARQATEQSLDFDMGTFEEDLARDLEFVGHDMSTPDADRIFGDIGDDVSIADVAAEPDAAQKPRRGMTIAAVVGGIAVLGVIGAFGLARLDPGGGGEPVLVKADPDPVKIVPKDPGGKQVPNQDRAVYGEVDGNGETAPTQETLVSTSEEPIDLNGAPLPNGVTENGKGEDRLLPDASQDVASASQGAESPTSLLTPRRVRTVIVKPDGSFVATEPPTPEPAAPTEPRAADNAGANAVASATEAAAPSAPAPAAEAKPSENTALQQMVAAEPQAPAQRPAEPVLAREPIRAPASIPERPASQPVQIATAQPAAAAATPGGYMVQIASQPSPELAQKTAEDLARRYANVLGGRAISIQAAEIEGRGTYHRVRVSASSRDDATALCQAYKTAGGSCFVTR